MLKTLVIIGSVREGRQGGKVGHWILEEAKKIPELEVELLDLDEANLPLFNDQPNQAVQDFRKKLTQADGFIFVTPEYNHGYPASLKSALDWAYDEWARKPAAFVGYSVGRIGGARAVEQLRQVAIELHMAPIREAIYVSKVQDSFDKAGKLLDDSLNKLTKDFFAEFVWWTEALKVARNR